MTASMPLSTLLDGIVDVADLGAIEVSGLTLDSRQVRTGDAFVALQGIHHHGIEFAPQAAARGAAVILAEAPLPTASRAPTAAPVLAVPALSQCLSEIAARHYGQPGQALHLIGVTGTNGKTSIVQLLAQALEALGRPSASIGTLGAGRVGALTAGERTTPDAISVQATLAQLRAAGAEYVAMEVSSHALVQGRVEAVPFELAVFTNLTRDHLDYHGSMQAYGAAKARLFAWPGLRQAVINVDDAFGRELLAGLPGTVQGLSYGVESSAAAINARAIVSHDDGIDFELHTPWGVAAIQSRLLGYFNVSNLLAVCGALGALGVEFDAIVAALAALEPVAGRMNRVGGGELPLLVVDYAHTPDALEKALMTLRPHTRGRLLCVFGAGGDRDRGKRPLMGQVVERLADLAIVTDDNPRSENGDAIVAEILAGVAHPERMRVERDRARAIRQAAAMAVAGDSVLIAGKGHERYQEIAGEQHPFDDLAEARHALRERAAC
ncbi:MAG TPA: UDP-N-acetylmuramoyl-L-alanyl-D-glutamate--2,6-diaminopimelate ligase [Rhodanobacteraceae bacterium]|nr:UDP-N-acetylmuramoyl-L-alanyl-D-glutamate--2,6-diaminopimelate ligase [Rhodanobacteraceae bacterium]